MSRKQWGYLNSSINIDALFQKTTNLLKKIKKLFVLFIIVNITEVKSEEVTSMIQGKKYIKVLFAVAILSGRAYNKEVVAQTNIHGKAPYPQKEPKSPFYRTEKLSNGRRLEIK
jgi:hypothetical protein